jgi:hypothetical protein
MEVVRVRIFLGEGTFSFLGLGHLQYSRVTCEAWELLYFSCGARQKSTLRIESTSLMSKYVELSNKPN